MRKLHKQVHHAREESCVIKILRGDEEPRREGLEEGKCMKKERQVNTSRHCMHTWEKKNTYLSDRRDRRQTL